MIIRKRVWASSGVKHVAWVVDARRHGGKRKQFETKIEAELYHDKLIRDRYAEKYETPLEPVITFKEFLEIYKQKKPWRTESYRERSLSALGLVPWQDVALSRITTQAIEEYRDRRLQKSKPSTVRQDIAALSDCFKWAVKLRYVLESPCTGVEKPSLPVKQDDPAAYLTPEQLSDLVAQAGEDARLYEFVVWTGLRITEVLTLEWPDVNFQDGHLVVRRGKGRKQRIVPLLEPAVEALKKVPKKIGSSRVFWWASDRHATLRRFQRRLKWAGIARRYRFHDLRHTFGAYAAQSGVDLEVISQAMGHSSTTVTKLYAHLSPQYKRQQLAKMVPKFRGTQLAHGPRKRAKT